MKITLINKIIIQRLLNILFGTKKSITSKYLSFFEKLRKENGLTFAITYYKNSKLLITRYVAGKPIIHNKFFISTEGGFPKHFSYLKPLADSKDNNDLRSLMTILSYTRSVKPTKKEEMLIKPKFNTVTDPYKGKKDFLIPMEFVKHFVNKFDLHAEFPKYDPSLHYVSGKGSPFGKSTLSAPYSLFSMSNLHHGMLTHFVNFLGQETYMKVFGNLIKDM